LVTLNNHGNVNELRERRREHRGNFVSHLFHTKRSLGFAFATLSQILLSNVAHLGSPVCTLTSAFLFSHLQFQCRIQFQLRIPFSFRTRTIQLLRAMRSPRPGALRQCEKRLSDPPGLLIFSYCTCASINFSVSGKI
jgi:hypothetical protein